MSPFQFSLLLCSVLMSGRQLDNLSSHSIRGMVSGAMDDDFVFLGVGRGVPLLIMKIPSLHNKAGPRAELI